jgi:hypothetical protein
MVASGVSAAAEPAPSRSKFERLQHIAPSQEQVDTSPTNSVNK